MVPLDDFRRFQFIHSLKPRYIVRFAIRQFIFGLVACVEGFVSRIECDFFGIFLWHVACRNTKMPSKHTKRVAHYFDGAMANHVAFRCEWQKGETEGD